jgi:uncharacterized protein
MDTNGKLTGTARRQRVMSLVVNRLHALQLQGPPAWLNRRWGGAGLDPAGRDLDKECGYPSPTERTVNYFRSLYNDSGVAARVVHIWPDECWAAYPDLYETEKKRKTPFERAWGDLSDRVNPWHFLHRADRLSGIGRFGILLLGLSGGDDPSTPAAPVDPGTGRPLAAEGSRQLLYLRAFDEYHVRVAEAEGDNTNPRYGQPTVYEINLLGGDPGGQPVQYKDGPFPTSARVHWTRIIHLADNRESSEIYGVPRCYHCVAPLHDIRKVAGSSAEMFWKGGFPGYQFKVSPDLVGEEVVDEEDIRQEVEAYVNGLQRYMSAEGGEWASLAPQVADPGHHIDVYLTLLCAIIGVPKRVFLGAEAGQLASTQDADAWKGRLRGRQLNYLEPMVVRPLIDRLMDLGCLPQARKYTLSWRDLKTLGDKDLADVGLKKVQALMQYVTGGVFLVVPPRLLFTAVLGFTDEQADAIITALGGDEAVAKRLVDMAAAFQKKAAAPQGGGRAGNPAAGTTGRPPGQLPGQTQT